MGRVPSRMESRRREFSTSGSSKRVKSAWMCLSSGKQGITVISSTSCSSELWAAVPAIEATAQLTQPSSRLPQSAVPAGSQISFAGVHVIDRAAAHQSHRRSCSER